MSIETETEVRIVFSEAKELEVKSWREENGELHFTCESISKEFMPPSILNESVSRIPNIEFRWRHADTKKAPRLWIGNAEDSRINADGNIEVDWVIRGFLPEQRRIQAIFKEYLESGKVSGRKEGDDKIGVSMGYLELKDKEGEWTFAHWQEGSGTPYPACKTCYPIVTKKIVLEESILSSEINAKIYEKIEALYKEKEATLNATIKELDVIIHKQKDNLKAAEDELIKAAEKITELENSDKEKDSKIKELEDKVEYIEKIAPVYNEVVKLEKEKYQNKDSQKNLVLPEAREKFIKSLSLEQLNQHLSDLKEVTRVIAEKPTSPDTPPVIASPQIERVINEKPGITSEPVSLEEAVAFAKKHNPELVARIKSMGGKIEGGSS